MKPDLVRQFLSTLALPANFGNEIVPDLERMARYKYDEYEMFSPSKRFMEHLYSWVKQFDEVDRETALNFIRHRLVFISQREMQDLAGFLYFDRIVPQLISLVIDHEKLHRFDYATAFQTHFRSYLRRCLFVGLSDGAKIDFFRRHHIDLSHEQVLPYYKADATEYRNELRRVTGDPKARFLDLFLIDDFTGSGYTLIREDKGTSCGYSGSLMRVYEYHADFVDAADHIYVCHYVATTSARNHVERLAAEVPAYRNKLRLLTALTLPDTLAVTPSVASDPLDKKFVELCTKYYDPRVENSNTEKGGGIQFGFGGHGLPLVLY